MYSKNSISGRAGLTGFQKLHVLKCPLLYSKINIAKMCTSSLRTLTNILMLFCFYCTMWSSPKYQSVKCKVKAQLQVHLLLQQQIINAQFWVKAGVVVTKMLYQTNQSFSLKMFSWVLPFFKKQKQKLVGMLSMCFLLARLLFKLLSWNCVNNSAV